MIRNIFCMKCGGPRLRDDWPMDAEDVAMGWKRRRKVFHAAKPKEHFTTTSEVSNALVSATRHDLPSLLCDNCGDAIPDGAEVLAETQWRGEEPHLWETKFMTLTPNAYDKPKP